MASQESKRYSRALELREEGQFAEAAVVLSRLLQEHPTPDAYAERAACFVELERLDEAIEDFTRAIELGGKTAELLIERGNVYELQTCVDEALADYDAVLGKDPANVVALNNRGCVLRLAGRRQEAMKEFKDAIALSPDYWIAHFNLSLVYTDMQRYREALRCLDTCTELARDDPQPWIQLGRVFGCIGNSEMALRALDIAEKMTESKECIAYERGVVFHKQGEYERAIAQFAKAIELDPSDWPALWKRAGSLVRMGRFLDAARDCAIAGQHVEFDTYRWIYLEVAEMIEGTDNRSSSAVEWDPYSIADLLRRAAEDASLGTDDAAKLSRVADYVQELADEDEE